MQDQAKGGWQGRGQPVPPSRCPLAKPEVPGEKEKERCQGLLVFLPPVGSDHPHLPLLPSSPLFSSPTLPKFQTWDKFQGAFGQSEAWLCPFSQTPRWFGLAVLVWGRGGTSLA